MGARVFLPLLISAALASPWPDTVIATVATGQHPNDACFSPGEEHVFVAVGYGRLVRVNTQSWTLDATLYLGGTPTCVACLPGNTVIVADSELNRLLFIDGDAMTVTVEREMNPDPVQFQVAPDGTAAYLTHADGFVSVIDPLSMSIASTVWVGNQPGGCHISPDGKTLFVADGQSPSETALTLPGGPVHRFVSGMDSFDCAMGGGMVYFSNFSWKTLLKVNAATHQVESSLCLPDSDPRWIAHMPDSPHLFMSSTSEGVLRVIDTDTFQQVAAIPVGSSPQRLGFSSGGGFLLVPCRGAGRLYILGYDPTGITGSHEGFTISAANPTGTPGLTLTTESVAFLTVTLHDIAGRPVAFLHEGALPPGTHHFSHPGLPPGVYHAVVRGDREGYLRLTVIR